MSRRTKRAFTLVELLVVIGIIALLISVLMPALGKSWEQARTTACLSNLRQIGQAFNAYANDNKGVVVPYSNFSLTSSQPFRDNWASTLMNGKYIAGVTQKNANSQSSDGTSVFRCPSGMDQPWIEGTPAFTGGEFSAIGAKFWRQTSTSGKTYDIWYGANAVNDPTLVGLFPMNTIPIPGTNDTRLVKLSRIKRSSQVALIYDGIGQHFGVGWGYTQINARHNNRKTTNTLFCDGHCESLPRSQMPNAVDEMLDRNVLSANCPYPKWRLDQ